MSSAVSVPVMLVFKGHFTPFFLPGWLDLPWLHFLRLVVLADLEFSRGEALAAAAAK